MGVSAYKTIEGGKYYSAETESAENGVYLPEYTPLDMMLFVNGTTCTADEHGVYRAYVDGKDDVLTVSCTTENVTYKVTRMDKTSDNEISTDSDGAYPIPNFEGNLMFKIDGISEIENSTAKDVTSVFLLVSVDKTAPMLTLSDPVFYADMTTGAYQITGTADAGSKIIYGDDGASVNAGSDGTFTGAASCMGYVLFFKENCIHKLYGSKPSDYQLSSVRCRGVAANAAHSLCVLNETLYYLSPGGVMAWDGSLPSKVSGALDTGKLTGAAWCAAGSLDARYYLYLRRQGDSAGRLLVYDTERGLWHEESAVGYEMASTGRQLYLWDGRALWAADPDRETEGEAEAALQFEAVSGDIGLTETDDKYISRITLRLDAQTHSVVTLAASYDGGPWETLRTAAATGDHARLNLPFEPRRHDTMRLKLSGTGQIALRSMAFTLAGTTGGRVTGAGPRK